MILRACRSKSIASLFSSTSWGSAIRPFWGFLLISHMGFICAGITPKQDKPLSFSLPISLSLSLSLSLSSPFLSLRFSFSCSLYIFLYAGAMVHAYMLVSWCKTHLNLESVTLVAMVHAYMLVSWYTTHLNLESVTLGYLQYSVTPMLLKWCYLQYLVISMLPKSCYLQYLAISMLLLRCLSSQ